MERCWHCDGECSLEGYCLNCGREQEDEDDAPEGLKREEAIGDMKLDIERNDLCDEERKAFREL